MQRYCPICGDVLPENSRLCPNCDREKIEVQRLSRQNRSRREAVAAPRVAEAVSSEPDRPQPKKNKLIIIVIIAVAAVALIVCGVIFGLNMNNSEETDEASDDIKVVTYDNEYYAAAEDYFRNSILSEYSDFGNTYSFTTDKKGHMYVENLDRLLLDYALVDLDEDRDCDIVTVELCPDEKDHSLLAVYKIYNNENDVFSQSESLNQQQLFCYKDYPSVISARFYDREKGSYTGLLSRENESENKRVDRFTLADGNKLEFSRAERTAFKVGGESSTHEKMNSMLRANGMQMFVYTDDDEPDFGKYPPRNSLRVKYNCEDDNVYFEIFTESDEDGELTVGSEVEDSESSKDEASARLPAANPTERVTV